MKSKKIYKCECFYVLFPFGFGMPICSRVMLETGNESDLFRCKEKGCKFYKKYISIKER